MASLLNPTPSHFPEADAYFQDLCRRLRETRADEDLSSFEQAYEVSCREHAGQRRASGEPYIVHPLAVTEILLEMKLDMVCLMTGLLHDTVEDSKKRLTIEDLRRQFGDEVAACVDGVTKLKKVDFYSRQEQQAENVRKMLLAMVKDIRVILVKFADRLDNMRTLKFLSREKQERIAQETLDIYAPIANRLGMGKVRAELEDLAFAYLEPEAYADLERQIESRRVENEAYLRQIQRDIEVNLSREGIPARVDTRVKRAFSVHLKLRRQKINLDQVYDLLGVRIITDSLKHCYASLGVIHGEWPPIPGRIKDFIAIPRPNLYQSLHTSVIGPGGINFEVQIRTEEMHRLAEEGIAAHWKYKEGRHGAAREDDSMAWLRGVLATQEIANPIDYYNTVVCDLYPDEVYTFTPKGKVITLPRGATPVDFAYAIHSGIGDTCIGAKVNSRLVPLKTVLRNGDVVEIQTQAGQRPSRDWLTFVRTARARNKIRHVANLEERAQAVDIGNKSLEQEARRLGVGLGRKQREELERVAGEYGYGKTEDLIAALGFGKFSARQVLSKIAPDTVPEQALEPELEQSSKQPRSNEDVTIRVSGMDDMLIYRAKCCSPIRGEPIIGYVTRGKGVGVHSLNCSNVKNLMYDAERQIQVEWSKVNDAGPEMFPVKLTVHTDDRLGLLHNMTSVLLAERSNVRTLEANNQDERAPDGAVIDMIIDIKDKKQLERVVGAIRRLPGVRDVERVQ